MGIETKITNLIQIEAPQEDIDQLVKEKKLAHRLLSVQFKLDKIKNRDKNQPLDIVDQLEAAIHNFSCVNPNENFRDAIKSIKEDESLPHSHTFGLSI